MIQPTCCESYTHTVFDRVWEYLASNFSRTVFTFEVWVLWLLFYSLASLKSCAWLLIFLTLLSRVFLLFVFSLVLRNSINYIKYLNIIVSISFFNDHELFVLNSNRNRIHVSKLFVHSIFQSIAILNHVSWTWNESENKNQSPRNWNWNNQTTNQNWNWKFYKENCRSTKMCELNRKREFIWSCFFFRNSIQWIAKAVPVWLILKCNKITSSSLS